MNHTFARLLITLSLSLWTMQLYALPDAGSLMQQQKQREQIQQRPLDKPVLEEKDELIKKKTISAGQKIAVTDFILTGDITVFKKEKLLALLDDAKGQSYDLAGLEALAARITKHYQDAGYFLVKVWLPPQDVTAGTITFAISEGILDTEGGGIHIIDETQAIKSEFAVGIIGSKLIPGQPVNEQDLERVILLLDDLQGISVSANLEPGTDEGSTQVQLAVNAEPLFSGYISADNGGSYYTGADRLSVGLTLSNLSGYGDILSINTNASDSDNTFISLNYRTPIGYSGLTMGLNYSDMDYLMGKEFRSLKASGVAHDLTLDARYPIYRSRMESLYLTAAYDWKDYKDEANGIITTDKTVDVGTIGINWDKYDDFWGGGLNLLQLQIKAGELDLSGSDDALQLDQLATGPKRNGSYSKLSYAVSRLQSISEKITFLASLEGQLTDKNLDSSERLQMGGSYGVRAYPVGDGIADEGYKITFEGRYMIKQATALGDIQASVFYDRAELKQFHKVGEMPLFTPNDYNISGWGLGLSLNKSEQHSINLSWAKKIGKNPMRDLLTGNDGDGKDDKSRFWLSASWFF